MAQNNGAQPRPTTTALAPTRMPIAPAIAQEYQLSPGQWRVLIEAIWPSAKTPEAVMMALEYCRARKLDPFKKPVHIVPMWSSAKRDYVETVWPGISELRTTAARTGHYAGIDAPVWGPMIEQQFTGMVKEWDNGRKVDRQATVTVRFPEWVSRTCYRIVDGVRVPFTAEVFWTEAYSTLGNNNPLPNPMWQQRPRGQLDKCAEAAAIRMAFPEEAGEGVTAEEMEGKVLFDAGRTDADPLGLGTAPRTARPGGPPPAPKPATVSDSRTEPSQPSQKAGTAGADNAYPNPDEVIARAEKELAEVATPGAYAAVWSAYAPLQEKLQPADWEKLVELATAAYNRVHDDAPAFGEEQQGFFDGREDDGDQAPSR
jgi:phage recombination protein Bet